MIYTVGYEKRDLASFIELLRLHGVERLIDVRLTPLSRKPGFSKTKLGEALAQVGIGYLHLRELGNPADNRDAFRAGDHGAVQRYRAKLDNGSRPAVEQVVDLAREQDVAMLCFEREHASCHRHVIADLAQEMEPGLVVIPLE